MTRLTEFREHDPDAPVCPMRGTPGRRATVEEVFVAFDGSDLPIPGIGEYFAICIACSHVWIHKAG